MSATTAVASAPVDRTAQRVSIIWGCVAVITCLLVALVVTAPIAQAAGHTALALSVYKTFSYLCHQIPERSFHLAGHKFGVCSRCTGLYSGFALAALVYPLTRSLARTDTPRIFWLILAAALLAIDFSLGYFSICLNTHLSRFVTGALLGAVAVFYIVPGLIELTSTIKRSLKRPGRTSPPLAS